MRMIRQPYSVPQVTVLAKKPVDPSPAGADDKDDGHDSDREIMVQFPPWPAADDASVVIPAPPNFATAAAGATATTVAAAAAAVPSSSAVPNSVRKDTKRLKNCQKTRQSKGENSSIMEGISVCS